MIDVSGHLRNQRRENGFSQNDQPVVVNCCGYQAFYTKSLWKRRQNGRVDYQLIYVHKGRGEFLVQGKQVFCNAGTLILYRPGEAQYYGYHCEDAPEVYWVHFTGYQIDELLRIYGIKTGYVGESLYLKHMFQEIIMELQLKKVGYETIVVCEFCKMIAWIGRMAQEREREEGGEIHLDQLIIYLNQNYQREWSVKDMAEYCGFSVSYFGHMFKKIMRVAPMQYLTKLRMMKAKDLLMEDGMTIAEVADLVGYGDPLYFSRVFKKVEGVSPGEYRQDGVYREMIRESDTKDSIK